MKIREVKEKLTTEATARQSRNQNGSEEFVQAANALTICNTGNTVKISVASVISVVICSFDCDRSRAGWGNFALLILAFCPVFSL